MYSFVKEKSENTHILSCEVLEIENKYNINFPTILREYYLKHRGNYKCWISAMGYLNYQMN